MPGKAVGQVTFGRAESRWTLPSSAGRTDRAEEATFVLGQRMRPVKCYLIRLRKAGFER